ncbi:class I SAM-dependent methyltransferase [Rosistilla oblonga]|uniref:class I SAM-dependent methyltransferase n=1 Tax=Rosistilla oblonga TaxID=2527990 RepID=UPI003A976BF6
MPDSPLPESSPHALAARPAEQFLIQQFSEGNLLPAAGDVLTTSLGRAQLAAALAASNQYDRVDCWYIDLYQANHARAHHPEPPASLNIVCESDPPEHQYDLAVLPLGRRGETELVRDQLQSFFNALKIGGQLWVAVDNPTDKWVHEQIVKLGVKPTTISGSDSIVYGCVKTAELKKQKNYGCEFAIRDRGRLLKVYSRPSVFSHRRIDPGARHLIDAMPIEAGMRVLDLGCGAGTVSLAAATAADDVTVHCIDSNSRAVQCTLAGAELNQLTNVTASVSDTGQIDAPGSFDLVLGNPPYYADFRIAELFMATAHKALRSGGRVVLVGKDEEWYTDQMPVLFHSIEIQPVKGYLVASGTRL